MLEHPVQLSDQMPISTNSIQSPKMLMQFECNLLHGPSYDIQLNADDNLSSSSTTDSKLPNTPVKIYYIYIDRINV